MNADCEIIKVGRLRTLIITGELDKDWQTSDLLPVCQFSNADKPFGINWITTDWNRYQYPLIVHFDDPQYLKLNIQNYSQPTIPYGTGISIMLTYVARG
jgi:hypothetical protein